MSYERNGEVCSARCRLVVAADGRESAIRKRLRFASNGSYLLNGFGPDAIAKRRLREMFTENPLASPVATALLGAWILPEESYSNMAWNALVAA